MHREPYHWFIVSAAGWACSNELDAAVADLRTIYDRGGLEWRPRFVRIYRVPGDETAEYEIDEYRPEVDGTLFCGTLVSQGLPE